MSDEAMREPRFVEIASFSICFLGAISTSFNLCAVLIFEINTEWCIANSHGSAAVRFEQYTEMKNNTPSHLAKVRFFNVMLETVAQSVPNCLATVSNACAR